MERGHGHARGENVNEARDDHLADGHQHRRERVTQRAVCEGDVWAPLEPETGRPQRPNCQLGSVPGCGVYAHVGQVSTAVRSASAARTNQCAGRRVSHPEYPWPAQGSLGGFRMAPRAPRPPSGELPHAQCSSLRLAPVSAPCDRAVGEVARRGSLEDEHETAVGRQTSA